MGCGTALRRNSALARSATLQYLRGELSDYSVRTAKMLHSYIAHTTTNSAAENAQQSTSRVARHRQMKEQAAMRRVAALALDAAGNAPPLPFTPPQCRSSERSADSGSDDEFLEPPTACQIPDIGVTTAVDPDVWQPPPELSRYTSQGAAGSAAMTDSCFESILQHVDDVMKMEAMLRADGGEATNQTGVNDSSDEESDEAMRLSLFEFLSAATMHVSGPDVVSIGNKHIEWKCHIEGFDALELLRGIISGVEG